MVFLSYHKQKVLGTIYKPSLDRQSGRSDQKEVEETIFIVMHTISRKCHGCGDDGEQHGRWSICAGSETASTDQCSQQWTTNSPTASSRGRYHGNQEARHYCRSYEERLLEIEEEKLRVMKRALHVF